MQHDEHQAQSKRFLDHLEKIEADIRTHRQRREPSDSPEY
jgi:hypothetical protein